MTEIPFTRRTFFAAALASAFACDMFVRPVPAFAESGSFDAVPDSLDLMYHCAIFKGSGWGNTTLVRQVDAEGKTHFMLCDGANSARRLVEWLTSCGVDRLDYLYLSHMHGDHVGAIGGGSGVFDLLEKNDIEVGCVIFKPMSHALLKSNPAYVHFYDTIVKGCIKHGIPMLGPAPGAVSDHGADDGSSDGLCAPFSDETTRFKLGEANVRVLNWQIRNKSGEVIPMEDAMSSDRETYGSLNEDSLGLLIEYDGRQFLISGDIEDYRGDEERVSSEVGPIDFDQLGHHCYGRSNRDENMQRYAPALCVNTARYGNRGIAGHVERFAPVIEMSTHRDEGCYVIRYMKEESDVLQAVGYDGVDERFPLRPLVEARFVDDGAQVASVKRLSADAVAGLYSLAVEVYDPTMGRDFPGDMGKEGCAFYGWFDADGNAASADTAVTEDVTYMAKWTYTEFDVSFDANGGEGIMQSVHVAPSDGQEVPACGFTSCGHMFDGWNTVSDGSGTVVTAGSAFADLMSHEQELVLYAQWAPLKYRVVFDANGGTGEMESVATVYGEKLMLPACGFTREGYTFTGWRLGDETYHDGESVVSLTGDSDKVVMQAQWEANRYVIVLTNGASVADMVFVNATYDKDVELPSDVFGRFGCFLTGWTDESGNFYENGATVRNLCAEQAGSVVLRAQWETAWDAFLGFMTGR